MGSGGWNIKKFDKPYEEVDAQSDQVKLGLILSSYVSPLELKLSISFVAKKTASTVKLPLASTEQV